INLIISIAIPIPRVTVGNTKCDNVSLPETGNIFRVTENNNINIIPIQKLGIAFPITDIVVIALSINVFLLVAEITPKGIETIVAKATDERANFNVAGKRSNTTENAC